MCMSVIRSSFFLNYILQHGRCKVGFTEENKSEIQSQSKFQSPFYIARVFVCRLFFQTMRK